MKPHRASRIAHLVLLALLPFLFFWRLFAPNPLDRMWLPDGDLTAQYFPLRIFAAREIAAGHLPLWNPHLYAGQPALADSQLAALYPVNLLTSLALALSQRPFTFAVFQLQIVVHYALAALFTYAFAYRLTRQRGAAWVAALVFTYGGYLISFPAQQPTILASAVWLPLVLLCLDWAYEETGDRGQGIDDSARGTAKRRWVGLALAGAAMALSIYGGHPQTALYVFYTSLAYWLYLQRRGGSANPTNGSPSTVERLSSLSIFICFALGLSALQWLPTLEFTRLSSRAQLGYAFTSGGFALHEIITLLIPGYFGGSPLYVGVIPLLLIGAALMGQETSHGRLISSPVSRRPSAVLFWLLLALVALFLSFGDAAFVYALFYLLAPGFALVRNQERAVLLWAFALAMLAALGAARLREWSSSDSRFPSSAAGWILLGLAALIVLAYLGALASVGARINLFPGALRQLVPSFFYVLGAWALWRMRAQPRVMLALVALIALNLFSVNAAFNFQKPTPPTYFPETALTRALRAELQSDPLARVASEGLLPGGHNAGAIYGFADLSGNDPLHLAASETFDQAVQEPHRLQLLGARYVVTKRGDLGEAFARVAQDGDIFLYRYTRAQPRAWLVHDVRVVAPAETFDALNAPDFDAATSVVLNAAPPITLASAAPRDDSVEITAHGAGYLAVHARTSAAALLVIGEVNYPGWQARVNGQPVQLVPANGILLALPLARGEQQIELTFAPDLVKIGAVSTAATILAWLALLAWARRRP